MKLHLYDFHRIEELCLLSPVTKVLGLPRCLKGRNVLIVEDIVDTGNTLLYLLQEIQKQQPLSIKTAALFYKPKTCTNKIKIDYLGMEIPEQFIIGYGLDYLEKGRNLKDIYIEKKIKL